VRQFGIRNIAEGGGLMVGLPEPIRRIKSRGRWVIGIEMNAGKTFFTRD
jgi:hypothetical protein